MWNLALVLFLKSQECLPILSLPIHMNPFLIYTMWGSSFSEITEKKLHHFHALVWVESEDYAAEKLHLLQARKQLRMWVNELRICSRMIGEEQTQNKSVNVFLLAFSLFPSTWRRFQIRYSFIDLKKLQDEFVKYLLSIFGLCFNLLIFSDYILSTF